MLFSALLAGCATAPRNAAPIANVKVGPVTVHDIDWKHRSYHIASGDVAGDYMLVNGVFERGHGDGDDHITVYIDPPLFGELDGNDGDEALIHITRNIGRLGQVDVAQVFTVRDGAVRLLGTIDGGDRGAGGLFDLSIAHGAVVLSRNESNNVELGTYYSMWQHEEWNWTGAAFAENQFAIKFEHR